jgi:hypothetical protein
MKKLAAVLALALTISCSAFAQDVVGRGVKDTGKAATVTAKDTGKVAKATAKDTAMATVKVARFLF